MRPDKLYAPDMPDEAEMTIYIMKGNDIRLSQCIITYLNHPEIVELWDEFRNETPVGKTSVLYRDYNRNNGAWSINVNTTDENKMIDIQTELIKYVSCDEFTIYQSPNGYLIVFSTDKNFSEILDFLMSKPEIYSDEMQMIPIAWETKH